MCQTIRMRCFLLFIYSLISAPDASGEIPGCLGGWFEFTCSNPHKKGKYEPIKVSSPKATTEISKHNELEKIDNLFLYHDTRAQTVRVSVRNLVRDNSGKYWCEFNKSKTPKLELELEEDDHGCQNPLRQAAYLTTKSTVSCGSSDDDDKLRVGFLCKDRGSDCVEVQANGRFKVTRTKRGFDVSISDVSAQDAGVYWCGQKSDDGTLRSTLRRMQLDVQNVTSITRHQTVGQTLTYPCEYPRNTFIVKLLCRGNDPDTCQPVLSTSTRPVNGRVSMKDDRSNGTVHITMTSLTRDDAGTYWCGARSTDNRQSDLFFHRLVLTVGSLPPSTPSGHIISTTPTPSTVQTTSPTRRQGDSWPIIVCVAVICVAALTLLFVVIYRRFRRSQNTTNSVALNEDHCYAEIQERPPEPDRGTALKTVYVTANFHTNVQPPDISADVTGDARSNGLSPAYSTVNHPSLYSTIDTPQQH